MAIRKTLTPDHKVRIGAANGSGVGALKRPAAETKVETKVDSKVDNKLDSKVPTALDAKKTASAQTTFVDAKNDVPLDLHVVQGGPVAGAVNARSLLVAEKAGRSAGPALTAEARLTHLLGKETQPAPSNPPKSAILEKMVTRALGDAALHMSALEVAKALGAPSWADEIHRLGFCDDSSSHQPNWLLAVHLSKWMEAIAYPGASLPDVAQSFLAANPGLQDRFPHLDGNFVDALQAAFPFMPQWKASPPPGSKRVEDEWDSLVTADPYSDKLKAALEKISEVPLTMKLTGAMADKLIDGQPFIGANVVMVQHMLGQANPLVDAMTRAGMDVTRAEYVGIPYQKNPAVKTTLEQGHGLTVTVPEVGNIDDMWKVITAAVDRAWERHEKNGEPILILDDGGYASKYIADKYKGHGDVFKVVEQTTRGLTEISKIEHVEHAIVDVAGSYGKRFESAQVGDAVKMAVRRVLDAVTTTPTRKDVLIVGAGKVGEGVADSFAGDGARITIYDPFITPARKKELELKGFTIVTDKAKALDKKFLVVGCSGHRSIDMADFAKMSSPVFLASASSKRVEIDTLGLGELATDKEGHLRKILAAKVNEQETWHYFLEDGRIVTAMADGLPVNFQAVNSIAPELIDHTMALMFLGGAQAMAATKPGLNALEPTSQFWLQAQMEGLGISNDPKAGAEGGVTLQLDELTFYGSRADWMRVAISPATPPAVLHELFKQLTDWGKGDAMDSIALAILSSKHELGKETIDLVLEMQCLPHVGRLLHNEGISDEQEDRLLTWLERSFWAAAGTTREIDAAGESVTKYNAVAVEGDAKSGYNYLYADVVDAGGKLYLAHRVTTVSDAVTSQASDLLFAHPRAPQYLREAFLRNPYGIASDGLASTVLRVQSPAWSSEDLDQLFKECASAAFSRSNMSGKRESLEYSYDLLEAFRDHPSASSDLALRADEYMGELAKTAQKKGFTLQGMKGWTPSPLGISLPNYK